MPSNEIAFHACIIISPRNRYVSPEDQVGLDFGAKEALPVLSYVTIMNPLTSRSRARREFLKFLAASPYVAALGGVAAFLERGPLAQNTAPGAPTSFRARPSA